MQGKLTKARTSLQENLENPVNFCAQANRDTCDHALDVITIFLMNVDIYIGTNTKTS